MLRTLTTTEPGPAVGNGTFSSERGVSFECRTRARCVDILADGLYFYASDFENNYIWCFNGKVK